MEAQQNITEHVVDDPLAPARLPALAQISDFWKRYDRLADIHDKKMTSNLNENLDVLLIFAALFSAINTTFISITMPDLFPNPSDETNTLLRLLVMRADNNTLTPADLSPPFSPTSTSIVVNCLLYASLSCSLLAAVGAMMSKEWLQSFDRTGQTGPLEDQGRFRQRKFDGVEQWHLEAVIKFLPNLLLLSVILFFAGIGLFLLPINTAVAGIVITFSGLGVILSGISIIAGALSPMCPYQSAASNALRHTLRAFSRLWAILRALKIIRGMLAHASKFFEIATHMLARLGGNTDLASGPHLTFPTHEGEMSSVKEKERLVTAQATSWLLQTTSNRGDQIAAARFIRTLDRNACALAFLDSATWRQLSALTRDAFDAWQSQPTERNQEVAEIFGLALCHVPFKLSESVVGKHDGTEQLEVRSSSFGETLLQALELTRAKYSTLRPEYEEYVLHVAFLFTMISRGTVIHEYKWAKLSRLTWVGKTHHIIDALLGLWSIVVNHISQRSIVFAPSYYLKELTGTGENIERLAEQVSEALWVADYALRSVQGALQQEQNAARGYAACLQRARELAAHTPRDYKDRAAWGVTDLIRNYCDPIIMSNSGDNRSELVELSTKAVLGLRDLIRENPVTEDIFVRTEPGLPQVEYSHLFDAAGDILDDPNLPTRWGWNRRPVKPSIARMLLWLFKNMSKTPISDHGEDMLFASSCRLWVPFEKEVEFSKKEEFGRYDKPLTSDDLQRMFEFVEYVRKDRRDSQFVSRGADVGINRLYVHFDKRVDWEYQLYDIRDQCTWCSRFTYIEDGLL